MILDAPLFPYRSWVNDRVRAEAEATRLDGTAASYRLRGGTLFALEQWVRGGTFHRYGVTALDALRADVDLTEALDALRENEGELSIEGELRAGFGIGTTWNVFYRRAGGIDGEYGGCAGYSTPEDAAYACLTHIEEHEREAYLEQLVIGVA